MKPTRSDLAAILLSLLALAAVYFITVNIFEGVPHIEDETAYSWQAAVAARGDLTLSSPACQQCFLVPFVVDYQGQRFGKYPPGWPAALSLGVRLDARDWVNPILAALCVWLTYRIGKKLINEITGLIAATLTLTSPFFLMNAGTLLSHVWSFFLTLAFILAWLDLAAQSARVPGWMLVWTTGLSLGLLTLTRPLDAAAMALSFFVWGLILIFRGSKRQRLQILSVGLIILAFSALFFLWQAALTGDPLLNPYTLWWPYDRLGFGPGVGYTEGGHNLAIALTSTRMNLRAGQSDLFGWGKLSWIFAPFGLVALRRLKHTWPILAIAPSLILFYMLYWIGSWVYGPRYYFEGLISMTLISAAGIGWLAGRLTPGSSDLKKTLSRLRLGAVTALVACLVALSTFYYSPIRIGSMHALNGASRSQQLSFESPTARELTPALIIVHTTRDWREYTTLLEISSPYFDTPFVFSYDRGNELNLQAIDMFPTRSVYRYYPDKPDTFYTSQRP